MKLKSHSFARLALAFALSTQLLLLAPVATRAARSSNDSNSAQHEGHTAARTSSTRYRRCRERCLRQYRQCLRGVSRPNRARCGQRYRACLGRCRR